MNDKALTTREPQRSGIYQIVHLPTGKEYVGSAVCLWERFRLHRISLQEGKHHCQHLQHAWIKYGSEQFVFQIIELVSNAKKLIEREQFHIDTRQPVFNICRVAGSVLGVKRSAETKRKISVAMKGNPKPVGFGSRLSIAIMGHSVSPETRAKISAGHKGVPWSAEARKAHITANKIRKETP